MLLHVCKCKAVEDLHNISLLKNDAIMNGKYVFNFPEQTIMQFLCSVQQRTQHCDDLMMGSGV